MTTANATQVVNIKAREEYDVYIGRPSKWGNPFFLAHRTREKVIRQYREWLMSQPNLLAALPELRGKRLGCYCAPLSCHGDVLAELANNLSEPKPHIE